MQRFVTYIYAYENNQKTSNTGYAKIETRGNNGWMEIHFSANEMISGEVQTGFLYIQDEKIHTIPIGTLYLENGRGMGQYTFRTEMILDTKYPFEKMVGLEIIDKHKQKYMSFWKDIDLRILENSEEKEVFREETKEETVQQEKTIELEMPKMCDDTEEESLHTMELPVKNMFPGNAIEEVWNNFQKRKECVQINEEVCAIQIELSDLRELPKCYWYLGNNSFLLHGFFNYRYLLLGKLRNGRWFIGVPGVYERQERVMASIFGFMGFMSMAQTVQQKESASEQMAPHEMQQGVWYHILES